MYNRYIPQSDGSYRRSSQPEQRQTAPPRQHTGPQSQQPTPPAACPPPRDPEPAARKRAARQESPLAFLKHLLPRDFDTGDLLIVLLLLLMAGDCMEDQNTAILTLALYLFL